MPSVRLRFVDTNDSLVSRVIRGAELGLAYSQVEAVTPDGLFLGALSGGGVQSRPSSYDTTWSQQLFVDAPATDPQAAAFDSFLQSKIDLPYDMTAIAEMADGALTGEAPNWPAANAYTCSALVTAALLTAGLIKGAPATVRLATPRDVLVACAALTPIGAPEVNPHPALALAATPAPAPGPP
jgi:hypothetical protein